MSEPFPVLVSYAYLRECEDSFIDWLFSRPELRMLLDSGAFTALSKGEAINVQDYIGFLQRWKHRISRYAALDVINNPEDTRVNLFKMLDAGLKPMPVFVTGEPQEWLEELYKHSDIVAIPLSLPVSKSMSIRRKFMTVRMAWAAERHVHWFGFTEQRSIEKWKPYSCDSSSWLAAARYGTLRLYLGRGLWTPSTNYKAYCNNTRLRTQINKIAAACGYTEKVLLDRTYWRRNVSKGIPASWHVSYQLLIDSMVRYVREIRIRFGTWHYLSVLSANGVLDLYWLYQHIKGVCVAEIIEQPQSLSLEKETSNESSSTRVRRTGQHGASLPSGEGAARGGPRIVRRLRPAARAGAQFRQKGLLDVGDSD